MMSEFNHPSGEAEGSSASNYTITAPMAFGYKRIMINPTKQASLRLLLILPFIG